jgi:predicted RNA-binding protein YlxR (DUF448 family)
MTRVVRRSDGTVAVDLSGRAPGRGTYICDDPACHEPARLSVAIKRALDTNVEPGALDLEVKLHATS